MSKSQKGSSFEREICTSLSKWWSDGTHDDLFWRTGGSGGRAKTRGRKGKRTKGQHGDLAATDLTSQPLIDLLTIELKRGYSKFTVADLLDKANKSAVQEFESWLEQVMESHEQAGTFAWLLIQKRDRRKPLVFFPEKLMKSLKDQDDCFFELDREYCAQQGLAVLPPVPFAVFHLKVWARVVTFYCTTLEKFLDEVSSGTIRRIILNANK